MTDRPEDLGDQRVDEEDPSGKEDVGEDGVVFEMREREDDDNDDDKE